MPRLFWCRPRLGIERLSALLGDISPESLPELYSNRGAGWYRRLFASGPPRRAQSPAARAMTLRLLGEYGRLHPEAAAAWLRGNWRGGGGEMLGDILKGGQRINAEFVLPFIREAGLDFAKADEAVQFPGTGKPDYISNSFNSIAGIEDPRIQESFLKALLKSALRRIHDPAARGEIWTGLSRLPEGPARQAGEAKFAEMLAVNAPARAVEWLAEHPRDAELANRILSLVIRKGFSTSKEIPQLVNLTLSGGEDKTGQERAAAITRSLLENAVRPEVSVEYVDALPEGSWRREAERVLAAGLPARNPVAASRWLNTLPKAVWFRDGAAAELALALKDDPEAAAAWAATVRDPRKRAELQNIISANAPR